MDSTEKTGESHITTDEDVRYFRDKLMLDSKTLLWVIQGLVGILFAVSAYIMTNAMNRVSDLEKSQMETRIWRSQMEGSRFTNADGLDLWKGIAELKNQIAQQPPPQWFVDRVNRLETSVGETNKKLDELSKEIRNAKP